MVAAKGKTMLINGFLDIFKRTPKPTAPKPADYVGKHSYRVDQDHKVRVEAGTLDAFYSDDDQKYHAQKLLDAALTTAKLKTMDASEGDFDPRPGHVVLPSERFEYHPDSNGTFQATALSTQVTGTTAGGPISLRVDKSYSDKQESGVYDAQNGTLEFQYTDRWGGPRAPYGIGTGSSLITSGDFAITPDGTIATPYGQTLAEANEAIQKRVLVKRASQLISAANFWMEQGQKLDNTAADYNSRTAETVAPNLDSSSFRSSPEAMARESILFGDAKLDAWQTVDASGVIDLQTRPGEFKAIGRTDSHNQNERDPIIEGSLKDGVMNITFKAPNRDLYEDRLVWDKNAGTVHYENHRLLNQNA